jgi:hypothetical protein
LGVSNWRLISGAWLPTAASTIHSGALQQLVAAGERLRATSRQVFDAGECLRAAGQLQSL